MFTRDPVAPVEKPVPGQEHRKSPREKFDAQSPKGPGTRRAACTSWKSRAVECSVRNRPRGSTRAKFQPLGKVPGSPARRDRGRGPRAEAAGRFVNVRGTVARRLRIARSSASARGDTSRQGVPTGGGVARPRSLVVRGPELKTRLMETHAETRYSRGRRRSQFLRAILLASSGTTASLCCSSGYLSSSLAGTRALSPSTLRIPIETNVLSAADSETTPARARGLFSNPVVPYAMHRGNVISAQGSGAERLKLLCIGSEWNCFRELGRL